VVEEEESDGVTKGQGDSATRREGEITKAKYAALRVVQLDDTLADAQTALITTMRADTNRQSPNS
jgi:hypothetical protein